MSKHWKDNKNEIAIVTTDGSDLYQTGTRVTRGDVIERSTG